MKKILVTGGAGFIGSNLVKGLQKRFPLASITILDNYSSGVAYNLVKGLRGAGTYGEIENEKAVENLKGKGFDSIFHLAAITDTTVIDEARMMAVNVVGFKNIIELAKHEGASLVYASSAGVYGNTPVPMKEDQELCPLNPYAVSKMMMDRIATSLTEPRMIGLRYFNVYGTGEFYKYKFASMIHQLMKRMMEGEWPKIFEHGEQDRDFIYVDDVVDATISAMEALENRELTRNVVINVGTGIATSFNRIVEILKEILGKDMNTIYFENPYDFCQDHTLADIFLAYKILGFKAKYSVEDGIKEMRKKWR